MRRNCNLELQLLHRPSLDETEEQQQQQQQQQQQRLTIFYNGMMCVRDVTELQARSILFLANRELMEERLKTPMTPSGSSEPSSPSVISPLCSPVAGLSMKRSLQRFLQKRQHRTQARSPYHHH